MALVALLAGALGFVAARNASEKEGQIVVKPKGKRNVARKPKASSYEKIGKDVAMSDMCEAEDYHGDQRVDGVI